MSVPYPLNQITPPDPEARGDQPPLLPRYSDIQMSEIVPNWGMPSNVEIPLWSNLNNNPMCRPAFHDTRRWLPSGRSNVDYRTGISTEMEVCRQFQRRGECSYGDQCRFLHGLPEKTRDVGFSSQIYEARSRTVDFGHVMDRRRRGFGQLEETRSTVQTIVACGDTPKPVSCKTRLCYLWQTTGHCPYGELCRFAHGEAELQKLESCSASERGRVGGASATTSATAAPGLRDNREIETDCANEGPRMKQFFKSKAHKKLIDIYADWLEN